MEELKRLVLEELSNPLIQEIPQKEEKEEKKDSSKKFFKLFSNSFAPKKEEENQNINQLNPFKK